VTPGRLRQIEELFHAARERSGEERASLLARADPDVRREVESLLARQDQDLFLDQSPIDASTQLMEGSEPLIPAGTCLGPYRVESRLGQGGMGEVFRAVDTRLGRAVAIKATQAHFSARFEREARAISALNHPNICTLYDIGPDYLVMELVEGETLAERLKTGPLPIQTALLYAIQIASALEEAHDKGIIHRDLKPGNIMIAKSGIKVLDFGLARLGHDETVTASRMILGTPGYMAPEQREGKGADARTDIYAFGCVLFEMLTGPRLGPQRKRVPLRKLEKIVNRCLEVNPDLRWQSVAELKRELEGMTANGNRETRILAAAVATLVMATAAYFYFHRAPRLTDKDTLVLADFVNNTGDRIFDGTLRQGLAVQLEQSPFLKIMDDGEVERVLRLMSAPPGTRISKQIAQEICVRQGAAATIDGTIESLGKNFVITLQVIACPDGATLAREQIQAEDKEHVLKAVGTAATAMRAKLGEPRNSIQRLNRPLEQATTPSLEALQNYSESCSQMTQGHFLETVPLFERAIEIDPNFAAAYFYLGVLFEQAGDMTRSAEHAKQAYRLVDHVSELERAQITVYYHHSNGEADKEIDACQSGIRRYPRSANFHNALSNAYLDLGRYEEGLREGLEATRLQPNLEPTYRRVLDGYICLDRLPEAHQLAQKLSAQGLDGMRIHQRFLEMAYVENDQAAIDREIQWFRGKPGEYLSLGLQAAKRDVQGQRREAHATYQRAAEAAVRRGFRNAASEYEEADARSDALVGNCQTARRLGRPALALAMCGDAAQAEKLAAEISKLFPNGTIWNAVQLPEIRAAIALHRDQADRSVELLVSASPYERSYLDAAYFRGLAYLRLHKGTEAVTEFQKIVDHKGANWGSRWQYPYWGQFYSLSVLGMARGSALSGDNAKAQKAFQDFFELWKDADSDILLLAEAKREYARLR